MNVTPKQLRILTFIREFSAGHQYSPTLQEIADEVGITKITVLDHLQALERRGFIRRRRYESRSIEVLDPKAGDEGWRMIRELLRVAKGEASPAETAAAIARAEAQLPGGRA